MRFLRCLTALVLLLGCAPASAEEQLLYQARVAVAVADLRREPRGPGPTMEHDPLEESQLLYGDLVEVLEEKGGWARVRAPDQEEWTHRERWEGYPGWMRLADLVPKPRDWSPSIVVTSKQAFVQPAPGARIHPKLRLSLGSRVRGTAEKGGWRLTLLDGSTGWIGEEEAMDLAHLRAARQDADGARRQILRMARLFLGDPYYWGGRAAHDPAATSPPHTAVDCSGLVGLVHQAAGVQIPRDAHEQWMKARQIGREELQPADLLFLSDPENPDRISHVALYAGDGRVIEGPGTGERVREISLEERLRQTGNRRVWFGSYLR